MGDKTMLISIVPGDLYIDSNHGVWKLKNKRTDPLDPYMVCDTCCSSIMKDLSSDVYYELERDGFAVLHPKCTEIAIPAHVLGEHNPLQRFKSTLEHLRLLFNKHYPEKKDSWRDLCLHALRYDVRETYEKYSLSAWKEIEELEQLLDHILVCLMLAERIEEELIDDVEETQDT